MKKKKKRDWKSSKLLKIIYLSFVAPAVPVGIAGLAPSRPAVMQSVEAPPYTFDSLLRTHDQEGQPPDISVNEEVV